MAGQVELYHQMLSRVFIASNSRLVPAIYDAALEPGNEYLLKSPYPSRMMANLNLKGAAVSIGTLSDQELKAVVEEAKPPKGPKDIG